jgi:hypothetical protein
MHEAFRRYVEALHPELEKLMAMEPVTPSKLPKPCPSACVYLFSEAGKHLYVGRTRKFRNRMRQHSAPGSQHNQAVFAFKLARESTGKTESKYTQKGSRAAIVDDPVFARAFDEAKARVRNMEVRFIAEPDPLRQALLEIYISVALQTPYNDFETH